MVQAHRDVAFESTLSFGFVSLQTWVLPSASGRQRPELDVATLSRLIPACELQNQRRKRIGCRWLQVIKKLSKSHYQKWLPVYRRAAFLAKIYESPRQYVDQIRRRPETRPVKKENKKKPTPSVSNGLWFLMSQRARNSQSGLVALAVIYYALCKSTSKSAQDVFYSKWSVNVNGFVPIWYRLSVLKPPLQT